MYVTLAVDLTSSHPIGSVARLTHQGRKARRPRVIVPFVLGEHRLGRTL